MRKGKGTKDYCTNDGEDRAQPPDPDGDRGKLQERGPTRSDEGSNGVAQHESIGLGAKSNPGRLAPGSMVLRQRYHVVRLGPMGALQSAEGRVTASRRAREASLGRAGNDPKRR